MSRKLTLLALLLIFLTAALTPTALAASESQVVFADVARKIDFPVYFPTFIPEGFTHNAAKSRISSDSYYIYFTGQKGEIMVGGTGGGADVGAMQNTKTLSVSGLTINIGEQPPSGTAAAWRTGDYNYAIIARGVTLDEMELIANSVILATGKLPSTGMDMRWFAAAFIMISVGVAIFVFLSDWAPVGKQHAVHREQREGL